MPQKKNIQAFTSKRFKIWSKRFLQQQKIKFRFRLWSARAFSAVLGVIIIKFDIQIDRNFWRLNIQNNRHSYLYLKRIKFLETGKLDRTIWPQKVLKRKKLFHLERKESLNQISRMIFEKIRISSLAFRFLWYQR